MSFLLTKDWIPSALLLSQESCIAMNLLWTVLHMLLLAASVILSLYHLDESCIGGVFLQEAPGFLNHSNQTSPGVSMSEGSNS